MNKDEKPSEVKVMPAMIEAGVRALYESGAIEHPLEAADRSLVQKVYLAMARQAELQ
jgi:hypothetical protein